MEGLSLEAWKVILTGAVLTSNVVAMLAGYYAWQIKRRQLRKEEVDDKVRRVHERIEGLKDRESDLRDRLARAEKHLEETPTSNAVHELAISISNMGGELKAVVAEMKGMKDLVERQEKVTGRLEDYVRQIDQERRKGG